MLDEENFVYYRDGISNDKPDGEKWSRICNQFHATSISGSHSTANLVWCINAKDGRVYFRDGIDATQNPHGIVWKKLCLEYEQKINTFMHQQSFNSDEVRPTSLVMSSRSSPSPSHLDDQNKVDDQMYMEEDFDIYSNDHDSNLLNQCLSRIATRKKSSARKISVTIKPNTVGTIMAEFQRNRVDSISFNEWLRQTNKNDSSHEGSPSNNHKNLLTLIKQGEKLTQSFM